MDEDYVGTANTVVNRAVGRFRDPAKSDLLVLTLRCADGDHIFALDRRMAMLVSDGLAETAKKLTAPRHEN
ncbi:MAG: hypothetical protein E6G97_21380 [Alphaproteobacteria bacterium]|nr:MAG: hypothetical protein E6G97_21380 [Alphaproteobacteria bacterium]